MHFDKIELQLDSCCFVLMYIDRCEEQTDLTTGPIGETESTSDSVTNSIQPHQKFHSTDYCCSLLALLLKK